MKVVLDANVVVSAYLIPGRTAAQILNRWRVGAFDLLVSEDILAEYHRVLLHRTVRTRHTLSPDAIASDMHTIRQESTVVEPAETMHVLPADPTDEKYIECAVAGEADYIVSGDAHLLNLKEHRGIVVLSPRAFLAVLGQSID